MPFPHSDTERVMRYSFRDMSPKRLSQMLRIAALTLRRSDRREPSAEIVAQIRSDPSITERILIRYRETFEILGRE